MYDNEHLRWGKVQVARCLRKDATKPEKLLWNKLRAGRFYNLKFRRQVPLGRYVADFVCFQERLIIEVDGVNHLSRKLYDKKRDKFFEEKGYATIRFSNAQVRNK